MLALVTDSTCGLTRNEAAELGVDVLPMGYAAAGIRHAEGFVGENGDYAPALAGGGLVTTEAVRPSAFERAFRRHLDAGNDVLCLTISSRLSGAFRSAEQAAEAVADPRVTVFDSWETAGALEFLVRRARALANAGETVEKIVAALTELRASTRIVFSVPDMAALSRSGRLGAIRRAVATKLNRYPVMALSEGGIVKLADGRGARGMAAAMADRIPEGDDRAFGLALRPARRRGPRGPARRARPLPGGPPACQGRRPGAHQAPRRRRRRPLLGVAFATGRPSRPPLPDPSPRRSVYGKVAPFGPCFP